MNTLSPPPQTVIFCRQEASPLHFLSPSLALSHCPIGAAGASAHMEELISWGVQQFISIAPAGALHTKASLGDLVVCEKAVRDENTSCRYLPSTKYIHAPRRMTSKLQQELKKAELPYHIGSTWTTDRLTSTSQSALLHYQQEGVLAIDREAAALFAVAHFYQVDLGILLTITGSPDDLLWQPHPYTECIHRSFQSLLRIAIQAVLP